MQQKDVTELRKRSQGSCLLFTVAFVLVTIKNILGKSRSSTTLNGSKDWNTQCPEGSIPEKHL